MLCAIVIIFECLFITLFPATSWDKCNKPAQPVHSSFLIMVAIRPIHANISRNVSGLGMEHVISGMESQLKKVLLGLCLKGVGMSV
jgi:hypothetical protein